MVRLSLPVGIYHPLSSTVHYMSPYTPYPVLRAASANQKDYKLMSNHSYTTYFNTPLDLSSAGPGFPYCFLKRLMLLILLRANNLFSRFT